MLKILKKVWATVSSTMESLGKAKAAAHLSRMGLHKEARALMLE